MHNEPIDLFHIFFTDCSAVASTCDDRPCANGGRCSPLGSGGIGGYVCDCPAGFQGDHCEAELDTCAEAAKVREKGSVLQIDKSGHQRVVDTFDKMPNTKDL